MQVGLNQYLVRVGVFLAAIFVVVVLLYPVLQNAFLSNVFINSVIILALVIGLIYNIYSSSIALSCFAKCFSF